jgi:hypothetical protein
VREAVNESTYHVIAATSRADFEACAAINNQVSPHIPVAAEQIEHGLTSEPLRRLFLVRVGGTAAGSGYMSPSSAGPRALYAMVRVVPEFRGRRRPRLSWGAAMIFFFALERLPLPPAFTLHQRGAEALKCRAGFNY